jgi:hypothetical protein
MSEDTTGSPTVTRRATDVALLIVAFVAVASWVWRRYRRPAAVDTGTADTTPPAHDDKADGTIDAASNAPV